MEHLSEEQRQRIVDAAVSCELAMALESTYVRLGYFESAAIYADIAEADSFTAFTEAERGRS